MRMLGRPKKERRRDSTEQPKSTRLSRVGTIIRCTTCKGVGHNKTSCKKKKGSAPSAAPSANAPSGNAPPATAPSAIAPSATPKAMVIVSSSQQSAASARVVSSTRKRSSEYSTGTDHTHVIQLTLNSHVYFMLHVVFSLCFL